MTYIRIAKAITAAQKLASHPGSIIISLRRRRRPGGRFRRSGRPHRALAGCRCMAHPGLGRPFTQQAVDVANAEGEDERIDDDKPIRVARTCGPVKVGVSASTVRKSP